jgi:hypothetical protein
LQKTQGVAIEVTYNGNQALLSRKSDVPDHRSFKESVAIRILHRVLGYISGYRMAEACLSNKSILKMMAKLTDPVESSSKIVKALVGAPTNTKILLTMDEIVQASDHSVYATEEALSLLCKGYLDRIPSLYLSVSVYGAIPLGPYLTGFDFPESSTVRM